MFATARTAALSAVLGLILAGCASHPPRENTTASGGDNIQASRQSMFVPGQNSALTKALRHALSERGWHLIGYDQGINSGPANYRAMARRARYRLTLSGQSVGQCRGGDPSFIYRITIIENHTGDVPVSLSGAKCLTPIADEFAADLDQKQLTPVPPPATQASTRVTQ